jgi:hypothetical protein
MPAGQFSGRLSSRNVKLFPPASVIDVNRTLVSLTDKLVSLTWVLLGVTVVLGILTAVLAWKSIG